VPLAIQGGVEVAVTRTTATCPFGAGHAVMSKSGLAGESFDSKSNAKRAAQNVKDTAPDADIDD